MENKQKANFDFISNLLSMARALGTDERKKIPKTDDEIDEILNKGATEIQSKMLMLEAYQLVSVNDQNLIKKVIRTYDRLRRGVS